jgi:hypothetical protein
MRALFVIMTTIVCGVLCQPFSLRSAEPDMTALLPENTAVDKFFKYSFNHLERGDARSLSMAMMDAYLNLCRAMHGCRQAGMELGELYQRRYVDLKINMDKMQKLGMILQRLISVGRIPEDDDDDDEGAG